jgi:YesN/AraC family two-component response regulator
MPEGNICYAEGPQTAPSLLIVEDNPDLRHFLHQSLAETYRITEAQNGQEAMEEIARKQPDLIISDIMMPVMRGDDLCQTLKSNMATSHIPVILLTALGDHDSILHGLDIKADSYVVKPFDIDILKANIASILSNKEFIRQRFAQLNYRTEDLPKEVKETPGLDLDQEFLTKATALIRKNLGKDFNVDDLCQEMGMSRSSLYNKVKALTDHSPSDFIRQVRMKEAAILLKSRKHTVAEVSDMMGFSDPKYFTETFKKHYGVTPSAYMKNQEP